MDFSCSTTKKGPNSLQILFIILVHVCIVVAKFDGCRLLVNGNLPDPEPLLLTYKENASYDVRAYAVPNELGLLNFNKSQELRVVCPGVNNFLVNFTYGMVEATATCVSGQIFKVAGNEVSIKKLACKYRPRFTTNRERSRRDCPCNTTAMNVGYFIPCSEGGTTMLKILETCYDFHILQPIVVRSVLVHNVRGSEAGGAKPTHDIEETFQNISITSLYRMEYQVENVAHLVGYKSLASDYVNNENKIDKGHLIPSATFVYHNQQSTTYSYLNVAPQWRSFRLGNWASLELSIRRLAARTKRDLDIYAGTFQISELLDKEHEPVKLYLFHNSTTNKSLLPVPFIFWKVIYDSLRRAGVAFVGLNNPYLHHIERDYIICEDVCHEIPWIKWDPHNIMKGYSYCCHVNDFRQSLDVLPNFPVWHLLTH